MRHMISFAVATMLVHVHLHVDLHDRVYDHVDDHVHVFTWTHCPLSTC
jgi:hypothetical protein